MTITPKYTEPTFRVPAIKLRQPDGSVLVKAGQPVECSPEVTVTEFHKEIGISKRYIATLCGQDEIKHRRLSTKPPSKILIPRTEIARFKTPKGEK